MDPQLPVGYRKLLGLPQHLRQPRHPRCRQPSSADRHRLALHRRHDHRVRSAHNEHRIPRRQPAPRRTTIVFSIRRITNPQDKSPQLCRFDQIASAEVTSPLESRCTPKSYPVLMAQLVALSCRRSMWRKSATRSSTRNTWAAAAIACAPGSAVCNPCSTASTATGAASRPSAPPHSAPARTVSPHRRSAHQVAPISRAACRRTMPRSVKSTSPCNFFRSPPSAIAYLFINTLATPTRTSGPPTIAMAIDRDHHHFRPATGIHQAR